MLLTVVDWNVNGFVHREQPAFLDSLDWDIACLQEVTRESWPRFRDLGDDGDVAFDYLPPLAGKGPKYACAVLVRGQRLRDFAVLRDIPSPERAAVSTVSLRSRDIDVCSWAAPPGVMWGASGKGRQVLRFAAHLRDRMRPVIVGIDRNAPRWERHDLADDEWWNKDEPLLYGPEREHDLSDAFRTHLDQNPDLASQLRLECPDGPLHVTHARRGIPCRYDAIYASPEFTVHNVEHYWDRARGAGSDHALVRASLELR